MRSPALQELPFVLFVSFLVDELLLHHEEHEVHEELLHHWRPESQLVITSCLGWRLFFQHRRIICISRP